MIDLHSHILPGLDDGAPDDATALEMARIAVSDGITILACTPHITPGIYNNTTRIIAAALSRFEKLLADHDIPLTLACGADVHVAPDLPDRIASGEVPTLAASRYLLLEPPHHVVPPNFDILADRLISGGIVPVITHPERLTWIASHYHVIENLSDAGCLVQITAGALTGTFGKPAQQISEKLLCEGRVDLIASDAHNTSGRPPVLSDARRRAEELIGEDEARKLVCDRPARIIENAAPVVRESQMELVVQTVRSKKPGFVGRLLGRGQ